MPSGESSADLFRLVRNLIEIPSITGNEGACCHFLVDLLTQRGWRVESLPVSPERFNVLAWRAAPEIVFSTHIDTVPPFIGAREDAEFVYGRGSCDAKGIVACQIVAAEQLAAEGMDRVGLLFLVGEETVSDGARAANLTPRGSRFLINGEPTRNKLALGTKGILWVKLHARGKMAHSAYPELGESAIHKLLDILAEIRRLPLPMDPVLGPATLNVGMISGGCAPNVIAGEAQAELLFRTVPTGEVGRDLRADLDRLLEGKCEVELVRDTPPMKMAPLDGFESDVFSFTTDLPSLTAWGQPFLLGPGAIDLAHTDHECVRKSELAQAVDLYVRMVRRLIPGRMV
jgi:acetylornithine deacetylase